MARTLPLTIAAVGVIGLVAVVAVAPSEQSTPAPQPNQGRGARPSLPEKTAAERPAPPTPAMDAADAAAIEQFKADVQKYVQIHTAAEKALPKLPTEATIQQIDANQRLLLQAITKARPAARRGDLFKPGMEAMLHRVMARVFEGVEGRQLRESIMEENPTNVGISVNGRYPDTVPLASMPPELLAALPKMPEELEYRFIGHALVVMDVHAHIIVDFVPNVLPR